MRVLTSTQRYTRWLTAVILTLAVAASSAQTKVTPDPNKYSPAQDVQLGREAAEEARDQLPMLDDDAVDDYVEAIGSRLVSGIPADLRHDEFRYTFDVVNQKEINAFALPGGPMFLHRGMLEAAKSEGEMAGVMAHEIAHVALRHGTAQATKGQKFQIGAIAGQILGAIVGGAAGTVISQGSQFGLGAYFLKYGREYERQADLLGAQIMARVGYDPREMASMFRTIESQGGRGGPEWLSSHPNPGNRYNAINKEASMLRVRGNANTGRFAAMQARLRGMAPAYTSEQVAQGQARRRPVGTSGRRVVQVEPPSSRFRAHRVADFLQVSVPANWRPAGGGGAVTYAPDGAVFQAERGETAFTHGVQFGVVEGGTGNLTADTREILEGFAESNPDLQVAGRSRRDNVGGRRGITTPLTNISAVTGQREAVTLTTTQIRDGSVLYMITVAPQPEASQYERAFRQVRRSVRIAD